MFCARLKGGAFEPLVQVVPVNPPLEAALVWTSTSTLSYDSCLAVLSALTLRASGNSAPAVGDVDNNGLLDVLREDDKGYSMSLVDSAVMWHVQTCVVP